MEIVANTFLKCLTTTFFHFYANFQLTNVSSLHSSSTSLGNPQCLVASINSSSSSTVALEPITQMASNAHSPKSPSQLAIVPSQTNPTQHTSNTAFRLNLDSTEQIPIVHQNGGSITGPAITSLHQATPVHVPLAMSTSLHSTSSTVPGFDVTTPTTWNSTSSLSPTMSSSTQHHRKLEVKLNAMP